ncbi:Hypothetical protein D9617_15g042550 [Elsinoe fawcettii]|nr:Hypothetical protein D9617_15g042550 [Elsinoe fawcettii]
MATVATDDFVRLATERGSSRHSDPLLEGVTWQTPDGRQLPQLRRGELLIKLVALGLDPANAPGTARDFVGVVVAEGEALDSTEVTNVTPLPSMVNGTPKQERATPSRNSSYSLERRDRPAILKRTSSGRHAPNWGTPSWSQPVPGQLQEQDTGSVVNYGIEHSPASNGNSTYALVERNGMPVFKRVSSGRHAAHWGTPAWSIGNSLEETAARANGTASSQDTAGAEDILVRRSRPSSIKRVSSGRHAPQWSAPVFETRSVTSPPAISTPVPKDVAEQEQEPEITYKLEDRDGAPVFKRASSGRHAPNWGSPSFPKPAQIPTPAPLTNGDSPLSIPKRIPTEDSGSTYKLVQRNGSPALKRVSSGRSAPQWSAPSFVQPVKAAEEPRVEEENFTYRMLERPDGTSFFSRVPISDVKQEPEPAPITDGITTAEKESSTYRLFERADGAPVFKRVSSGRHAPRWNSPVFTSASQNKNTPPVNGSKETEQKEKFTYRLLERADGTPIFKRVAFDLPEAKDDAPETENFTYRLGERADGSPVFKRVSTGRHAPQWSSPFAKPAPSEEPVTPLANPKLRRAVPTQRPSLIEHVVFGSFTDLIDVQSAAQKGLLTVPSTQAVRLPKSVQVKDVAAIHSSFVFAATALGVNLGIDFSSAGFKTLQSAEQRTQPKPGDWVAIWGADLAAQIAIQLAKSAGLRVVVVVDVAKAGPRLAKLGADMLVDRVDAARAVEILKAVTSGELLHALDTSQDGEGIAYLTQALQQTTSASLATRVAYKSFQQSTVDVQTVSKSRSHELASAHNTWLERLLQSQALKLPASEVITTLPTSHLSSTTPLVFRIASSRPTPPTQLSPSYDLTYATQVNSSPSRLKFAYWVPNVSGGLVISKIPQRTSWSLPSNLHYAQTAERYGFEYALSQIRFTAGYGAENQHEPVSISQALLHSTQKLNLIAALLPGPWNPAVAAKQIASIDQYTSGRIAVNVVSGWFKAEFTAIGQWWLDHAERYRRSTEFIKCLRGIWTEDKFTFAGDFYRFREYRMKPKPLEWEGRKHPEIFQGGNSEDARKMAGEVGDVYFMNGNTLEGFRNQIADVRRRAKENGREGQVRFAVNGFVICRETEEEAVRVLGEIQGKADAEAVEGFRQQVMNAGQAAADNQGMWAQSGVKDLVQYNDGFKTKLIGTKEQIAERILLIKSLGVDILLTCFLHYDEEIEQFGREVLPLVRELEAQGRGKDVDYEIERTGWIYR